MYKFVGSFSLVGFFIPAVSLAGIYFLQPVRMFFLKEGIAQFILFCLWPSSFLLMGYEGDPIFGSLFVIGVNIFLYTGVGYLFWLGKQKYHWLLYVTGLLILLFWSVFFYLSFIN